MRTLDDIIPPSRRQQPETAPPVSPPRPQRARRRFPLGTLIIVLFIIAVSTGALFYFASAEVRVTPLARTATVTNAPFTATAGAGELSFEVITVEKIATQSVKSSGTKAVSASASGTITVYNTQTRSQALVATTRFQTPSGLIFRTPKAIVVPSAKGGAPGQLTITVVADKPGSEYNIGPTSFVLPGFSGDPQYTQVTAKSTSSMTGGASGNEPVVAPETESATRAALMNSLENELLAELTGHVPQGYVLLAGATETTYAPLSTTAGANSDLGEVREQGTMRGVVLPNALLAKAIATAALADYHDESVTLEEENELILKPSATLPLPDDEKFSFTLSGTAAIVSSIEPSRISAAIAGKSRAEAELILKQYPEVEEAVLILRPFWRSVFPDDPSKISVETLKGASR